MARHFLTLGDLRRDEVVALIERAIELKTMWKVHGECPQIMTNRTMALVFEKASTRTRVSFEVAATQFGGNALFLSPSDSQLNRGESIEDTAKIVSTMADIIVIRTALHSTAQIYASVSNVPVINGLSDSHHPCQLLADLQTLTEIKGTVADSVVTWIGDGNNMCVTWATAASILGFKLRVCTPDNYTPDLSLVDGLNCEWVELYKDPYAAVADADVVVTDSWISMGQEEEKNQRLSAFENYQVTESLMRCASPDAVFMHCLPAYRDLEVAASVIDGEQSVVWQEAENRLHAQKALIELLLGLS